SHACATEDGSAARTARTTSTRITSQAARCGFPASQRRSALVSGSSMTVLTTAELSTYQTSALIGAHAFENLARQRTPGLRLQGRSRAEPSTTGYRPPGCDQ